MKKLTAIFMILVLLVMSCKPLYAAKTLNYNKQNIEKGLVLTINDFNNLYGNEKPDLNEILRKKTEMPAEVVFDSIYVQDESISFMASIIYKDKKSELKANGTLYNGYKKKNGINSVVGELTDENDNFDILLFEIYNDVKEDKTIVNFQKRNSNHLKFYLKDRENNIILFEVDIPEELQNISINNERECNPINDVLWFTSIREPHELKKIPFDGNMIEVMGLSEDSGFSTCGIGSTSEWYPGFIYYISYWDFGDYYEWYSFPFGYWRASNVTQSDSTWMTSFRIAEQAMVNGRVASLPPIFEYNNVTMTHCMGGRTSIKRVMYQGAMYDTLKWLGTGGYINRGSITALVGGMYWEKILPKLPSLSTIITWLNAIHGDGESKTITLGSNNVKLFDEASVTDSIKLAPRYKLFTDSTYEEGHYLIMQSVVSYECPSKQTSHNTWGSFKISWEVQNIDTLDLFSDDKVISFQYTSSY